MRRLPAARLRGLLPARSYYQIAGQLIRVRRFDVEAYGLDPFAIWSVSTGAVTALSGRDRKAKDAYRVFGAVHEGDWDLGRLPEGPVDALLVADRFEETAFFRSLRARYIDGVPWEATPWITEMLRIRPSGWPSYRDPAAIRRKCARLDALFQDIVDNGFKSAREIHTARRRYPRLLDAMEDEICIDIARDGRLLFFDGKHRLGMAKILGIERIPVVVGVRHSLWMATSSGKHPEMTLWLT